MTKKQIACLVLLASFASCKRKDPREYPHGLPRAFIEEAINMTEAVVPYCDDLLATNPCPRSEEAGQDFRNERIVKALPFLDHPFGDSAQVHDYFVSCDTLSGRLSEVNDFCNVRTSGLGRAVPAACEDHVPYAGWKQSGRGEDGEMLGHPAGPGCPQAQFKLVVQRKTRKGNLAIFIGNFKDPSAASASPQ